MLTKRQKQVLDFIKSYKDKHDYAPSLEEIKKHLRLSSVSTAHYHVQTLQNMGYLRKEENHPRALDVFAKQNLIRIPLLGRIAAGTPIEAVEDRESIAVPQDKIKASDNYFALKVAGKSMIEENIDDGDIVVIKQQSTAQNGERIVALLENKEVTLKKFYKERNRIRLEPANSNMEPILVAPDHLTIQGIVVDIIKSPASTDNSTITNVLGNKKIKDSVKTDDYLKKWLNTVQCMDCVEGLRKLPDNSIDLVVTSPPYDGIRAYNGFTYDLHATGKEIYRVLKEGGITAMVIQDQTKNFGKTLTTFKTVIDWCENVGFKLFETVIYRKHGGEGAWWTKRFRVDHEYIPIFLKGSRPQYFNKTPLKIPSKHGGKTMTGCATRLTNGHTLKSKKVTINPVKCRGTIWDYVTCGDGTRLKHQHPATFPDKLPVDFIRCFCPPGGIVLDPYMGSGTTAIAAIKLGRKYIGFDISEDYCKLAEKRTKQEANVGQKEFELVNITS
ncbi:MAG: transcriptional repressor LexA [Candidatus Omnitrophica bacterium]|nr:transcriptional repressor LexA [Candidatus Omnitrophota bacterium]